MANGVAAANEIFRYIQVRLVLFARSLEDGAGTSELIKVQEIWKESPFSDDGRMTEGRRVS